MPIFEVRNKQAGVVLGQVVVERPEDVLSALASATSCAIEDIAASLGRTVEDAKAALEIVEMNAPPEYGTGKRKLVNTLPPRRLFA